MCLQCAGKRKGEGPRLNDRQRMEIIALFDKPKPPSMRSIAREYGVNEKTIRNLRSNKDIVRERAQNVNQATQETTKRVSQAMFPELEKRLFDWIDAGRRMSLVLPPSLIRHKVRLLAQAIDIPDDKFKASWGWFVRFRHRYGLNFMNLCGEGGDVNKNDPELLQAIDDLVPLPPEDVSTVQGKKTAKDRVTLVVCCNATGTERLPIAMIGKAKELACISGNSWPIPYFQQKNAWIDVPTFNKWFNEVFEPHVRKRTGHKVLLILDNAPGHSTAFERNGIRVVFFPPNVTSWKQPMDMGIIAAIRNRYKLLLVKEIIAYHDTPQHLKGQLSLAVTRMKRGAAGMVYGRPPHLLDAANLVNLAWNEISSQSLKNYFKKADIIHPFEQAMKAML